jgi:signal transduction histidine kinase
VYRTDVALLHDVGHEVATLSALVAAVRGQGGLDAAAGERLELVEREIDRLLDLVGDHGLPSAAGAGDELVDLREFLREVVVVRDAASAGSVVLEPGPSVLAHLDPRALHRLVTNLVDNAVRAGGATGRVEVGLHGTVDPVVRVVDDGPGPGCGPEGVHGMGLVIVRTLARRLSAEVTLRPRRTAGSVAEIVLRGRGVLAVPEARRGSQA